MALDRRGYAVKKGSIWQKYFKNKETRMSLYLYKIYIFNHRNGISSGNTSTTPHLLHLWRTNFIRNRKYFING